MTFSDKTVLLISPEPWDHIFVSKHHYAIHLAKRGTKVIFLNPPKKKWKINETDYKNLIVLDYPGFIKGLRWLPDMIARWIFQKKLSRIENYCKAKIDVIWSFDNSVFFAFSGLHTLNISHIVDENQNFETKRAAQSADICFYITEQIGITLKNFNKNSFFINHGFNRIAPNTASELKLPGKNKNKLVYAGNLNMAYLDWFTLNQAVSTFPEVDFIFIGPLNENLNETNDTKAYRTTLRSAPNAYFYGRVPSNDLPRLYAKANGLMICYQEKYHREQSNTHKMMEYLGSGRPVIATYTALFAKYKGDMILMSRKNNEFTDKIKALIYDQSSFNNEHVNQQRIALALDNTYDRQIDRITQLLTEHFK